MNRASSTGLSPLLTRWPLTFVSDVLQDFNIFGPLFVPQWGNLSKGGENKWSYDEHVSVCVFVCVADDMKNTMNDSLIYWWIYLFIFRKNPNFSHVFYVLLRWVCWTKQALENMDKNHQINHPVTKHRLWKLIQEELKYNYPPGQTRYNRAIVLSTFEPLNQPCLIHWGLCVLALDASTQKILHLCRVWPGGPPTKTSPTLRSRTQTCTGSYYRKDYLLLGHSWADRLRRPTRLLQVHETKNI